MLVFCCKYFVRNALRFSVRVASQSLWQSKAILQQEVES